MKTCTYCSAPLSPRPNESPSKFDSRRTCNVVCARRQQAREGLNNRRFPPDHEDWWRLIGPPLPASVRFDQPGGPSRCP